MAEDHGLVGARPHSAGIRAAMRNRVAHRDQQLGRERARPACISDYAAHLAGSAVKVRSLARREFSP
jgi:hypothetical protein